MMGEVNRSLDGLAAAHTAVADAARQESQRIAAERDTAAKLATAEHALNGGGEAPWTPPVERSSSGTC